MENTVKEIGIALNQPLYVYQQPMFMLTVSVVLIEENGVVVLEGQTAASPHRETYYRFPGGPVKAGQETIQFSAVRQIKEQTGILLKKDALIPVDFRSNPERSKEGNIVDIGMVCVTNAKPEGHKNAKWFPIDFERKKIDDSGISQFYMDHDVLLERAIDVVMMMKE